MRINNTRDRLQCLLLLTTSCFAFVAHQPRVRCAPCFQASNPEADDDTENIDPQELPYRKRGMWAKWMNNNNERMVQPLGTDGKPLEPIDEEKSSDARSMQDGFAVDSTDEKGIEGMDSEPKEPAGYVKTPEDEINDAMKELAEDAKGESSWFEVERRQIMDRYKEVLESQIKDMEESSESLPQDAKEITRAMVQAQMEDEIRQTLNKRIQEMIASYEVMKLKEFESQPDTAAANEWVQSQLAAEEELLRRKERIRAEREAFSRYEEEASRKQKEIDQPGRDQDLDEWVLESMQRLADRAEASDNFEVLHNLDDTIDALQSGMERQKARRDNEEPDDPREWQMFRSIATQLTGDNKTADGVTVSEIHDQLDEWRDYDDKAEAGRRLSILSASTGTESQPSTEPEEEFKIDKDRATQATKEMNLMSIAAFEALLKTCGGTRRAAIEEEIRHLKESLEDNDFLHVADEEVLAEPDAPDASAAPVDIEPLIRQHASLNDNWELDREVMQPWEYSKSTSNENGDDRMESSSSLDEDRSSSQFPLDDRGMYAAGPYDDKDGDSPEKDSSMNREQPPLNNDETSVLNSNSEGNKPDTPFFTEGNASLTDDDFDAGLGTFEDQQLLNMYKQAGARSQRDADAIRSSWEEYQLYEKQQRDEVGLSDEDLDSEALAAKYSVSYTEDVDVDFDDILASIGPRPNLDEMLTSMPDQYAVDALSEPESATQNGKTEMTEEDLRQSSAGESGSDPPRENRSENFDQRYTFDLAPRQLGIEADVYGESLESSTSDWENPNFVGRKNTLLDYVILEPAQLNALMDLKASTRSSEVVPKIKKPLKAFGAVLRMEGVLVDTTGLSSKVWRGISADYGLRVPTMEKILQAAVTPPEIAIRNCLGWRLDLDLTRRVVSDYRIAFRKEFDAWAMDQGFINKTPPRESLAMGGAVASATEATARLRTSQASAREMLSTLDVPSRDQVVLKGGFLASSAAWNDVAQVGGYAPPTEEQLKLATEERPEEVVTSVFRWAEDENTVSVSADAYRIRYCEYGLSETERKKEVEDVVKLPQIKDWVTRLHEFEMETSVVSHLEVDQLNTLLEFVDMAALFPAEKRVSESSGYGPVSQQLLGAALRMERRPDHCIALDSTPHSAIAAHEAGMRSISMIGRYPAYDLVVSDVTTFSIDDIRAITIRSLVGDRANYQPTVDMQGMDPGSRPPPRTRYYWEGDED